MTETFLYDSTEVPDAVVNARELVDDEVDVIDVASWDEDRKRSFYFREIMSLSVQTQKLLGEAREDRHAGFQDFEKGLLITDDSVYLGEEVVDYFSDESTEIS